MEELTPLEKLNAKVEAIVAKVRNTQDSNASLQNELSTLREENESKNSEILRLQEESAMKDLEIEEITKSIEAILA